MKIPLDRPIPSGSSAELRSAGREEPPDGIPSGRKRCASVRMRSPVRMRYGCWSSADAPWFLPARSSAPPTVQIQFNSIQFNSIPVIVIEWAVMTSPAINRPGDVTDCKREKRKSLPASPRQRNNNNKIAMTDYSTSKTIEIKL